MKKIMYIEIAVLLALLILAVSICAAITPAPGGDTTGTAAQTTATEQTTSQETTQTEPPVHKVATATIGSTGDILLHDLIIASGYDSQSGTYDYNYIFTTFAPYVQKLDYAVANLEVTLCGDDNGYAYKGYPCFNSPDSIVDALKNAGFDMTLSANNHVYDTGHTGLMRTQKVLDEKGMDRIGTRLTAQDKPYKVIEVNGIKIGMINYTYNTEQLADGTVDINGITMTTADSQLVNSFNYWQLDSFYTKLEGQLADMKAEGAEATVIYMHWGDEYQTTPNSHQTKIAQDLCNMGFDVIVGNHAHVPQPVEFLTSEQDAGKKTLCLYSMGNTVSNIYETSRFPVNTEDGVLFQFTFAKYSDGSVIVESTRLLPTWMYRYDENNTRKFHVLIMDDTVADWKEAMNLTQEQLEKCKASYERTMALMRDGLEEANAWYAQNQKELEQALGIG